LYYSVKYLHRHPAEVNITIEQMGQVAYMAREIEKLEAEKWQ